MFTSDSRVYTANADTRDGKRADRPGTKGELDVWTPEIKTIIGKLAVLGVIGNFMNLPQAAGQDQGSSGTTIVVADHAYTINSTDSSANPSLGQLDVSGSKTIRINFRTGNCTSCSPVRVDVVSNSTVIETFNIDIAVNASRVYEVPGTQLTLRFANTIAGASNGVVVTVLGRSN